jgi:hypothetical protein
MAVNPFFWIRLETLLRELHAERSATRYIHDCRFLD